MLSLEGLVLDMESIWCHCVYVCWFSSHWALVCFMEMTINSCKIMSLLELLQRLAMAPKVNNTPIPEEA